VTLWPMDGTVFLFMGKNDLYERRLCVSYLTHAQISRSSEMRLLGPDDNDVALRAEVARSWT
jgi:hypothetical protein